MSMPIQQKRVLMVVCACVLLAGTYSLIFGPLHEFLTSQGAEEQIVDRQPEPTAVPEKPFGIAQLLGSIAPEISRQDLLHKIYTGLSDQDVVHGDGTYECSFDKGALKVSGDEQSMHVQSKELGEVVIDMQETRVRTADEKVFSTLTDKDPIHPDMLHGMILHELEQYEKVATTSCMIR